ncbi:hypothetical protein NPIL_685701 [Nephila pilipes]|uniref:Uncharacterized protein n=1 Tax=Nephila pilipes TaxID=299642 RepID=A0A8X6TZ71_NEPPI|nr:hypothetical protein NPIL_685701 [Nephila pilipes]
MGEREEEILSSDLKNNKELKKLIEESKRYKIEITRSFDEHYKTHGISKKHTEEINELLARQRTSKDEFNRLSPCLLPQYK